MGIQPTFHPQPPDFASGHGPDRESGDAFEPWRGDSALERTASDLERLGSALAREAEQRGVAERVFAASAPVLAAGERSESGSHPVVARIGWQRFAAAVAAAAAVGLAVLLSLNMLPSGGDRSVPSGIEPAAFRAELIPAGLSENLVIGLYDGNAALDAMDLSGGDVVSSVVITRAHDAVALESELQGLLNLGGGR